MSSSKRTITLTKADFVAIEREYCTRKLSYFAQRAWHVLEPTSPLKWGWALDAICDHLEAVTSGDINRLLINVSPGSMKSLLTSVLWPAWEWGAKDKASRRYLSTSHKQDLATRDNVKCRRLIQSSWYQSMWPVQIVGDQNQRQKFENSSTGFRESMAFGSMTGSRGDCLLAGSLVDTNLGKIAIENIVNDAITCYALSYEQNSRELVYRPIQAVARRTSQNFYRVHTSSGVVVECTGDHRFYTARGYIEARLLSSDDVLLRVLQKGNKTQCIPDEEARKEWPQDANVQPEVLTNNDELGGGEVWAKLQRVRIENHKEAGMVLFSDLQGEISAKEHSQAGGQKIKEANGKLQSLQYASCAKNKSLYPSILLKGLQGYSALINNEGRKQSRVEKWDGRETIHESFSQAIPQDTRQDIGAGREKVRCLFSGSGLVRASHRYESEQQRMGKFSYVVSGLSCNATCEGKIGVESDYVALVERICEPVTVYDLQVEETRCFFANGILVHNCVIIDDAHSVDDANSRTKLASDVTTFREALPSRVNSDESSIVIIMQRLAVGDISDVALELGYQHLLIPMRYEVGRSKHVVGTGDPRTVEGELMFPERFPEAQVVELEKSLGSFATAGQLQQRPNPRGGRIIRTEWLELYSIAPELEYRAIYADTALKTEERHDYSVFQCWGKGKDGKLYLLDMIRGKWEAPELERRAVAFWNKHQADQESRLRHLKVEDKASGTGLIQGLRLKAHIPVAGIQRSRDKYTRLLDVVGYIEAGMVRLPKDAPYLNDFLAECESFSAEGTHAHDDQIDPFIDAITDMLCITSAASLWARMT